MSALREQGMAALKEGNLDKAVDFLARAVLSDDNDIESKALLGVAYSQKGLHVQAKRALLTCVEREPQNQNYRFNLAVVMERGGDQQGAALAYRDLLQLNPQHAQARAKLQAMGPAGQQLLSGAAPQAAPPAPPGAPGAPPGYAPPQPGGPPPGYGAPPGYAPPGGAPPPGHGAPVGYGAPPMGAPQMAGPPIGAPPIGAPPIGGPPMGAPPGYGPPPGAPPMSGPPGYGAPAMGGGPGYGSMQAPPGTIQCPGCGQFARVGMLCEFCNNPLPPPPRVSAPPPTYGPMPAPGRPMPMGAGVTEEDFNVGDGFQSWFQVLIAPNSYFQEQVGVDGIKGPSAYVLAYAVAFHVITIVASLMLGMGLGGPRIGSLFFGWACVYVFFMIGYFVWGGLVHLGSKIVGGQAGYDGSFRAAALGSAPYALMLIVAIGLLPLMVPKAKDLDALESQRLPHRIEQRTRATQYAQALPDLAQAGPHLAFQAGPSRPSGGTDARAAAVAAQILGMFGILVIVVLVGWLWSLVTTGIGIAHIHSIGAGQAVGAVLLSLVFYVLLWFGLSMLVGTAATGFLEGLRSQFGR